MCQWPTDNGELCCVIVQGLILMLRLCKRPGDLLTLLTLSGLRSGPCPNGVLDIDLAALEEGFVSSSAVQNRPLGPSWQRGRAVEE